MFPPFRGRGFPVEHGGIPATKWCPSSIAKLVQVTPISLGLMVGISMVDGVIK